MADKSGVGQHSKFDFLNAIASAKTVPESPAVSNGQAVGLPAIFETEGEAEERDSEYVKKEANPIKLGVETYLEANSKVFVIYRPWEKCSRCKEAISDGEISLPTDVGDHTCLHTQLDEYQAILNAGLKGDIVLTTKEAISTPDGVQRVHLEWLAPNEDRKRAIERKLRIKKTKAVYPPDVDAAFKKKEEVD